ncbi:hypothetical protein D3C80_1119310 [compost metagenome]
MFPVGNGDDDRQGKRHNANEHRARHGHTDITQYRGNGKGSKPGKGATFVTAFFAFTFQADQHADAQSGGEMGDVQGFKHGGRSEARTAVGTRACEGSHCC